MNSIIIAFAILLERLYEMMRFKFHNTLFFPIVVFLTVWILSIGSQSIAFAQDTVPSPTPQASSTGMYVTVITEEPQINVRMGPSSSVFPIVGKLPTGSTAPALGRSPGGDWIEIEFPSAPNGKAWVYSPLVQVSSPGTLQIVEPPPTPVPPATPTIDPTLAAQFTIQPTATRLPTFTPPPAVTLPVFTQSPARQVNSPVSMAVLIASLGLLGVVGFVLSLFIGHR